MRIQHSGSMSMAQNKEVPETVLCRIPMFRSYDRGSAWEIRLPNSPNMEAACAWETCCSVLHSQLFLLKMAAQGGVGLQSAAAGDWR